MLQFHFYLSFRKNERRSSSKRLHHRYSSWTDGEREGGAREREGGEGETTEVCFSIETVQILLSGSRDKSSRIWGSLFQLSPSAGLRIPPSPPTIWLVTWTPHNHKDQSSTLLNIRRSPIRGSDENANAWNKWPRSERCVRCELLHLHKINKVQGT